MEVTVEFVGGPLDGKVTLPADTQPQEGTTAWFAWMFYRLTKGGMVGKKAMGASPAVFQALLRGASAEDLKQGGASSHKYEVVEREEGAGEVCVKAKYVQDGVRQP
jgi:hypothetical protein